MSREHRDATAFALVEGFAQYIRYALRTLGGSPGLAARSAEMLFLRKQLAFYEERQVQPRRLSDAARFFLVVWSRLLNWKDALVIVKPETLIGWHRKSFKLACAPTWNRYAGQCCRKGCDGGQRLAPAH